MTTRMLLSAGIVALTAASFPTPALTSTEPRFRAGEKILVFSEAGLNEVHVTSQGVALTVGSPTLARVLKVDAMESEGTSFCEVRVLEGSHAGMKVLVDENSLRRRDGEEAVMGLFQTQDSQFVSRSNAGPTPPVP